MKGSYVIYMSVFILSFLFSFLTFKSESKSLRLFVPLLFLGLLTEGIVNYGMRYNHYNLPWLYRAYIPVEYALIGIIYLLNIQNAVVKKWIWRSVFIFGGLGIFFVLNATKASGMPALQFSIEGFMILTIASYNLLEMNKEGPKSVFHKPFFWIDVAFLLYYSGNFFIMSLFNTLKSLNTGDAYLYFNVISRGLNILLYLLLIIAFLCSARVRK